MAHLTFLFRGGWQNHSQCCHFQACRPRNTHSDTCTHTEVCPGHIHTVAAIYKSPESWATLRHSNHSGLANSISVRVCACGCIRVYTYATSRPHMFISPERVCRNSAALIDAELSRPLYMLILSTWCLKRELNTGTRSPTLHCSNPSSHTHPSSTPPWPTGTLALSMSSPRHLRHRLLKENNFMQMRYWWAND